MGAGLRLAGSGPTRRTGRAPCTAYEDVSYDSQSSAGATVAVPVPAEQGFISDFPATVPCGGCVQQHNYRPRLDRRAQSTLNITSLLLRCRSRAAAAKFLPSPKLVFHIHTFGLLDSSA